MLRPLALLAAAALALPAAAQPVPARVVPDGTTPDATAAAWPVRIRRRAALRRIFWYARPAPMRLTLAAVLALATVSASAQTEPMRPLPRWHRGVEGNFRPPQTSAARAYVYAVGATGALVTVGYVLDRALTGSETTGLFQAAGGVVMAVGVIAGPMVGNLSLGAGEAAQRGFQITSTGVVAGGVLVVAGLGAGLGCVLGSFDGGDCGTAGDVTTVLFVGGAGVMAAGVVAGAVYNLVTIPASARWAQRARAAGNRVPAGAPRVSVVPGYDLRHEAPMLTLRARL